MYANSMLIFIMDLQCQNFYRNFNQDKHITIKVPKTFRSVERLTPYRLDKELKQKRIGCILYIRYYKCILLQKFDKRCPHGLVAYLYFRKHPCIKSKNKTCHCTYCREYLACICSWNTIVPWWSLSSC